MKIRHGLVGMLLVSSVARPVLGQTEKITLYADAEGSDCSITDAAPGVVEVHMIHVGPDGRRVSVFIAPKPDCWTGAIWLGDVLAPGTLAIGTTQTNLSVGYAAGDPSCPQLPIYIGKINYFGVGTGQPCCEYPVLPSPTSEIPGSVVVVDCAQPFGNLFAIGAGKVTINENSNCPCDPPVAVEESTWGRMKALYR